MRGSIRPGTGGGAGGSYRNGPKSSGEQKAKIVYCLGMARRRDISNEMLNEAELAALRQRLSAMTLHDLESFYKATHNACRYTETRAPTPAVVQEFVQAWKQLRRAKRRF